MYEFLGLRGGAASFDIVSSRTSNDHKDLRAFRKRLHASKNRCIIDSMVIAVITPAPSRNGGQGRKMQVTSKTGKQITITPCGPWRLYQHAPLPGWDMLGTVQRGAGIGALARNRATGNLIMMCAGAASMLDQRKAQAALQDAQNAGA